MKHRTLQNLFVSATMCRWLFSKGITGNVPFQYHIYNNGSHYIVSDSFDYMGLYDKKIVDVAGVKTEYIRVPAYTVADMLALLPDYEIRKEGNLYQVQCEGHGGLGAQGTHQQYAEAAALCVKSLIDQKILSADSINLKIQSL